MSEYASEITFNLCAVIIAVVYHVFANRLAKRGPAPAEAPEIEEFAKSLNRKWAAHTIATRKSRI